MRALMTGCVTGRSADLLRQIDAAVEGLVPHVAALLAGVSHDRDVSTAREEGAYVLSAPIRFPDGIGRGTVVARVFRYRTSARVDITLVHNRVMAFADGRATNRACFLNDFKAAVTLGPDAIELPEGFVRQVMTGVRTALGAVDEHNRRHPQPWRRIRVAAAEPVSEAASR
jgi:hypothetical protein